MSSIFCCSRKARAHAPEREEDGGMSIMQRGARKCGQAACDIFLYTTAGVIVGAAIGGVCAYPAWDESIRINDRIEGAMKAREGLIESDPSVQFITSLPIMTLAIERNNSYSFAVNAIQITPIIGGIAGFGIGSIVGAVRLLRSVCHLHKD